jgi:hypothetical protein
MKCPNCGAYEPFAISMQMEITIYDQGIEWPREEDHSPYWDEDSPCRCETCDYSGEVRDFNIPEEDHPKESEQMYHLRLTIDVVYAREEGEITQEDRLAAEAQLDYAARHLADAGLLSGETPLVVERWSHLVEEP